MPPNTEADAVAALALKSAQPFSSIIGPDTEALFVPVGFSRLDLEPARDNLRGCPRRRRGNVAASTIDAFCALVSRHLTPSTVVYADTDDTPSFVAVVNDHDPTAEGKAGFRDHRVLYAPQLADPWEAWIEKDGSWQSQSDFAAFLEDRALDLVDAGNLDPKGPSQAILAALGVQAAPPATLRGLARDMNVRVKMQVREARNLASGETQVVFATEHTTDDGRPLTVPGAFLIAIPVFFGGALFTLVARLRYRISGGSITWSYNLARADDVRQFALAEMLDAVRKTGALVVEGRADG